MESLKMGSPASKPDIELLSPARTLEDLLRQRLAKPQRELLRTTEDWLSISFFPERIPDSHRDQLELYVQTVVEDLIEDLAAGAAIFSKNSFGIILSEGKLFPFVSAWGANVEGSVIFRVSVEDKAQGAQAAELSDQDVCLAIYRLIVFLALET